MGGVRWTGKLVLARAIPWLVSLVVLLLSGDVRADVPEAPAASSDATALAREEFARGNELGKKEDWAEALAAFQRSYQLRPHPTTRYNIGTCHRVLGRYTAARELFEDVLRPGNVEQLPAVLAENARGYKDELDRVVAHVVITIAPPEAGIAIDGRPLQATATHGEAGMPLTVAGVLPSAPGTPPPAPKFEVVVDPGTRVIVLSRKGYKDIVRTERFAPGARTSLQLDLEKLDASLRITANVDNPIVTINGVDVGMAPVSVPRIAGSYRVIVTKDGYVPHDILLKVAPGETSTLDAALVPEKIPITKRWWFWAGVGVLVAGAATVTYFVTRPDPTRPELSGGGLGWTVPVQ